MATRIDSSFRALVQEVEQQERAQDPRGVSAKPTLEAPPVQSGAVSVPVVDHRAKAAADAKRIANAKPADIVALAVLSSQLGSVTFRAELRQALKDSGRSIASVLALASYAHLVPFCVALCEGSTRAERECMLEQLHQMARATPATLQSEAARTAALRIAFFPSHGEQLVVLLDPKLFSPADLEEHRREISTA